ncbi:MAG: hypothetical protein KBE04_08620 [Phycisphaerae bacterium]|nr:hypothetical protein [Phycisphaerae bacterium]
MRCMSSVLACLLLAHAGYAAAVQSNGTGGGLWSAPGTWAGGVVPVDGDTVTLVAPDVVTFDADQSGFASGIGLTISSGAGLECSVSPGVYTLKCNASLTLNGTLQAGVSASEPLPAGVTFTIDFNGTYTINCGSAGHIALHCTEPAVKVMALTAPADAGATVLQVDTDGTGDLWTQGGEVRIDDVSGGLPDSEGGQIAEGGITAGTLTLTSGLAKAKTPGAKVFLVTRNIRIINGKGYAVTNPVGGTVAAEIRTSNGINGPSDLTLGGTLSGCTNGINFGQGVVQSGVLSGCTYGLVYCAGSTNRGTISGCSYGFYSGSGNASPGGVSGCYYGIYYAAETAITGEVSGCFNGVYGGGGLRLTGAALTGNTYDLRRVAGAEIAGSTLGSATENYQYQTTAVPATFYICSVDHDQVPGAFKAWTRGGVVLSDVNTVPEGYATSFRHVCESEDTPCFRQAQMTVEPGLTLRFMGRVRVADDHSAWAPRFEIIDPTADPLADPASAPLASAAIAQPDGSFTDWQNLNVSFTNTGSIAKKVLVRCSARRAQGDVYEVWTTRVVP